MPLPERVLIETTAFCTLILPNNQLHKQAKYTYERLIDWGQDLWTTSYVIIETSTLLRERQESKSIQILFESIQDVIQTFWIRSNIHNKAYKHFMEPTKGGLSLVDWTTLLSAQQLDAHLFTFNTQFARLGIPVLPRCVE